MMSVHFLLVICGTNAAGSEQNMKQKMGSAVAVPVSVVPAPVAVPTWAPRLPFVLAIFDQQPSRGHIPFLPTRRHCLTNLTQVSQKAFDQWVRGSWSMMSRAAPLLKSPGRPHMI